MTQGPNVKKLIAHKMANLAIPPGSGGDSLMKALGFLSSKEKIISAAREATVWVEQAIAAVRSAPDNQYTTDEEIAGAILKGIEERNKEVRK